MNIVGEGVPNFVTNQILVRQKIHGSGYLKSRTSSELVYLNANTAWCKLTSGTNVNNSNELARKFILFNGTTPNGTGISTTNGAYTVAQDEFGFRPMPGIISANINHENRGSLKRAEVKIKCYNIEQFRILDLLYLRLGYNILLEWGHSMYYTEDFNNEKKLIKSLNGAGISLAEDFLKGGIDYDEFLFKILAQRRNTQGNYDALFARVENFSWSFNKDGSYDITLKLISIGDVIESLKVNVSLPTSILAPTDPSSTQTSADVIRNYSSINSIGAWLQQGIPSVDLQALMDEAQKLQDPTYIRTSLPPATTQGTTINSPQSNFSTPMINGLDSSTGNGFKLTFDLIDPNTGKPINPNTNKPYEDPLQSPNSQLTTPTFIQVSFKSDLGTQYYVKLGDFLSFLQNGDSNKSSIIPKIFVKGKTKGVPQLKFNLVENQNLIYVDPAQISVDPTVCFVKRNITINNTTYSYSDDNNKAIDFTIEIEGITYGKILDVYVNSAFIISTIQNNTNTLGKLDLYTFLDKLIKSINSALGGFNELELIIDETTNEIKIIDKNPLPNKDKLLKTLTRSVTSAEFLLYGYTDTQASFVKDFNFKSEIPPSLATTLVVASQREGIVVGIDGTGFSNLNKNLTDRFKEKITNDISIADELRNNIQRINSVNERWGEYKNFLISLSTDSSLGYTTDNCATKSNCNTYKTTLKDLIKINASFKDIKLPPPNPNVNERTPIYDQDGNLEGYALSDSKVIEDNEKLVNTTKELENLKITLNRNNIGNSSSTSGFLPFNLSLTINGLSGMKMYQKFIIDTRYLPANYPSNVEFLIKNVKHQISDQQWTTQLESFAITKNASSSQVQSQNYLNDLSAQSKYSPGRIIPSNGTNTSVNNPSNAPFVGGSGLTHVDDPNISSIRNAIARIAKSYFGQAEVIQDRGFKNTDFEKRMRDIGWRPGSQWCNFFTDLVWKEAYQEVGKTDPIIQKIFDTKLGGKVLPPLSAQVWFTLKAAKRGGFGVGWGINATSKSTPQVGDMIVHAWGHISLCVQVYPDGSFARIGGNEGYDGSVHYTPKFYWETITPAYANRAVNDYGADPNLVQGIVRVIETL
jgi:hypothetical protein